MAGLFLHLGERAEARRLVLTEHYSERWPSNVQLIATWHEAGGLFGDSGPAVAACIFCCPAARWSAPVLELTRLVRVPGLTAPLSGLVAEAQAWVRRKRLGDLLVSYADPLQEHHGGIYQACSWAYGGLRPPSLDSVILNGERVPARTANHLCGTQSVERLRLMGLDAAGVMDQGKHLYWRPLGRAGVHKALQLRLQILPYPKPNPKD